VLFYNETEARYQLNKTSKTQNTPKTTTITKKPQLDIDVLTEKQKTARDNLELPFMEAQGTLLHYNSYIQLKFIKNRLLRLVMMMI
jgi:hypothetical protein